MSEIKKPTDEEIRGRAYERYLMRDGEPGSDMDDWLGAEKDLELGRMLSEARLEDLREPQPEMPHVASPTRRKISSAGER